MANLSKYGIDEKELIELASNGQYDILCSKVFEKIEQISNIVDDLEEKIGQAKNESTKRDLELECCQANKALAELYCIV